MSSSCLYCHQISKKGQVKISKNGQENTFGWGRAEVLGALINAVFLLALCVMIIFEAIEKFFKPEVVEQPWTVMIVGMIGLLINIIGMIIFRNETGMHGHSHGGGGDDHGHSHGHSHGDPEKGHGHGHSESGDLNMWGVYLHVLGDAFGSIVVVLSAATMYFFNNCPYDPSDRPIWANSTQCKSDPAALDTANFLIETLNITSIVGLNANQTQENVLVKFLTDNIPPNSNIP